MTAIPRYRTQDGAAIWSAGFRPFFLAAAFWAAVAVPLWLVLYDGVAALPSALPATVWHAHEMIFGYAAAAVAGFLLTAIPNWTGRMPLQGGPLAMLVALWALGRVAVLSSAQIGAPAAMALDLSFPTVFLAAVAREIIAGRNWRNLPMLGALALLLSGNLLVHLDAVGLTGTAALGNRVGLATLLMLITFVGGRLVPSFTRNWLAKERRQVASPTPFGRFDRAVLAVTGAALALWAAAPQSPPASWLALAAGVAVGLRLARWRGRASWREPLVWVLHLGYGWLAFGLLLVGFDGLVPVLPPAAALHALTVGAVGTMTLAVMTRASLGHTGRDLTAGPWTTAIYAMVTSAAVLRLAAPFGGDWYLTLLWLAGAMWSGAFGLFLLCYGGPLASPRVTAAAARPI
jgi:uncharacterized protein involved in response to NO